METWQINLKKFIEESGMKAAHIARAAGLSPATLTRLCKETGKSYRPETMHKILIVLRKSMAQLMGEDDNCENLEKVAGFVVNADIRLLSLFAFEQEEPTRVASNIRFIVEQHYPEFKEWLKKRGEFGADPTIPENKSSNGQ